VIVTAGTPATRAAKHATSTIPIIMTSMGVDPVASGLVSSLARPEGNITGVTALGAELYEQRLALLKEVVPKLARLAVFVSLANPNSTCRREVTAAAQGLGVQLHILEIRDGHAFEPAFAAITQAPPDALLVCWDALTFMHARPIADFAVRHRLPTMSATRAYVQAGALISYGTSTRAQLRRAADYVDKVLKGTKPADLPVERPTEFELVLNLQTAQALGLTLPPTLLFQATEVLR
jgi:putative tryptophan/tyrosine transport system substrate-binding protein